jgi:D-glucosaminate-6-phosphate ammonia-lyase
VKIVADRLHAVLSQKRSPKPATTPAPAANLSGRWDVNVEFFSSKSQHTLYLTQDGNGVQGSHKGEFSTRDVLGTIDGDQIKLRSQFSEPGDSVGFIFAGTLAGDAFSGAIYMGEYLNAKFTAKRHSYPAGQGAAIRIPKGPPLAN